VDINFTIRLTFSTGENGALVAQISTLEDPSLRSMRAAGDERTQTTFVPGGFGLQNETSNLVIDPTALKQLSPEQLAALKATVKAAVNPIYDAILVAVEAEEQRRKQEEEEKKKKMQCGEKPGGCQK